MSNKNILFMFMLIICVMSLIIGTFRVTETVKEKQKVSKNFGGGYNKVAIIELNGIISSTPEKNIFAEENSSLAALNAINEAETDNAVKGIIIRINSPGGTVGMSQRLHKAVMYARKKKPVISVIDDIGASGGYYVASASDRITALPGSMTGSIGVIMSTMDMHELLTEKIGIKENVIKSGKYKDIGSSTRAMTQEERELLQEMINDSYKQFKEAITEGRINRKDDSKAEKKELTTDNLNKYADGRVFTGRQALEYGFIDSTGGMREAQTMMETMIKEKNPSITNINFVKYGKTFSIINSLGLNQNTSAIDGLIPQSMKHARKPLYLWE